MQRKSHLSTYKDVGVDVAAGEAAVSLFSSKVSKTFDDRVLNDVGGFGALYGIANLGIDEPALVSSTDGVGTKTQLARYLGRYSSIGQDLVAMCVDDIACYGAKPLFFLDYLSVGKQIPEVVSQLVTGIADACLRARCSLIGGETAEHPGVMDPDDFDLGGFVVGVVDTQKLWSSDRVQKGDVLLGLSSPNLRSNGFSLVRKIYGLDALNKDRVDGRSEVSAPILEQLLEPSVIYSPYLADMPLRERVHAASHITGGGLLHNLARSIPKGLRAKVDQKSWQVPEVFEQVSNDGQISKNEMYQVFNMGIGMVLIIPKEVSGTMSAYFEDLELKTYEIGYVVEATASEERSSWIE